MAVPRSMLSRGGPGASRYRGPAGRRRAAWLSSLWVVNLAMALAVAGCADSDESDEQELRSVAILEGSVWYRERIALPPNTTIQVLLEDVARMDVPSDVLASTTIEPEGGPPWSFQLSYDPELITERGRYVLRARIEAEDGRLLFINTESIPAFDGDPSVPREVRVSHVAGRGP